MPAATCSRFVPAAVVSAPGGGETEASTWLLSLVSAPAPGLVCGADGATEPSSTWCRSSVRVSASDRSTW